MTWLYLDDRFPEHPKVIAAGGDAGWLWLCGYGYVQRHLTEGHIPKAVVHRLSDRKNPVVLAQRLVEVELWEDQGATYYMHDYDEWNAAAAEAKAKKEARREAARKAAEARWAGASNGAIGDANAMRTHSKGTCEGNAGAMRSAPTPECPPRVDARATPSLSPIPHQSSSESDSRSVVGAAREDDASLIAKAKALAQEALDAKRSRGEAVDNPTAYLAKVTRQRLDELRDGQPDPEALRRSAAALGQNWASVVDDLSELRDLVGSKFDQPELRDVAMRAWHEARSASA